MAKVHRKVKLVLWIVGSLIVLAAATTGTLFVLASRAVNDFRDQAAQQLNTAVAGKATSVPVVLRRVWLGDQLNRDYKKIDDLQSTYRTLLNDVKNYIAVLNIHNALVGQYNSGISGNKPLSGDLLNTANQYLSAMQSRFPAEKDRISALNDLSQKITSSTDFDAVSADINTILQSNNDWLTSLRDSLNARITEFQKKVD